MHRTRRQAGRGAWTEHHHSTAQHERSRRGPRPAASIQPHHFAVGKAWKAIFVACPCDEGPLAPVQAAALKFVTKQQRPGQAAPVLLPLLRDAEVCGGAGGGRGAARCWLCRRARRRCWQLGICLQQLPARPRLQRWWAAAEWVSRLSAQTGNAHAPGCPPVDMSPGQRHHTLQSAGVQAARLPLPRRRLFAAAAAAATAC